MTHDPRESAAILRRKRNHQQRGIKAPLTIRSDSVQLRFSVQTEFSTRGDTRRDRFAPCSRRLASSIRSDSVQLRFSVQTVVRLANRQATKRSGERRGLTSTLRTSYWTFCSSRYSCNTCTRARVIPMTHSAPCMRPTLPSICTAWKRHSASLKRSHARSASTKSVFASGGSSTLSL
jgi:hypothetical protein